MTVKQISIFLENRPGSLAELIDVLSKEEINMRAMSVGETEDFGILRIIVQDPYKAICVLKQNGYVCSITPVLAVAVPDEAGSLLNILNILGKNGVNLDYTYAFTMKKKDFAYMVFRVQDNEKAIVVLTKNKIELISQDDLAQM